MKRPQLPYIQHPDYPSFGLDVLCWQVRTDDPGFNGDILFRYKKDAERLVKQLRKTGYTAVAEQQYIYLSFTDFRDGL